MYSLRTDCKSVSWTYLAGNRFVFLYLPEYTLPIMTGVQNKICHLRIIIPGDGDEEDSDWEGEEQEEEEKEDEEG